MANEAMRSTPRAAPINGRRTQIKNHDYYTDEVGEAVLTWPSESGDLRIWVSHPDRVPLHAMWAKEFQSDGDQIPQEFRCTLTPGTKIGGVVKDEQGHPIAGAKVEIINVGASAYTVIAAGPRRLGLRPVPTHWLADEDSAIVTDADGRWSASNIPRDANLEVGKMAQELRLPPDLKSPATPSTDQA